MGMVITIMAMPSITQPKMMYTMMIARKIMPFGSGRPVMKSLNEVGRPVKAKKYEKTTVIQEKTK